MSEIVELTAPQPVLTGWQCLPCIIDHKVAETNPAAVVSPEIRDAVTLMNGMAVCYEHIVVQQQSPLAVSQGMPVEQARALMLGGR